MCAKQLYGGHGCDSYLLTLQLCFSSSIVQKGYGQPEREDGCEANRLSERSAEEGQRNRIVSDHQNPEQLISPSF